MRRALVLAFAGALIISSAAPAAAAGWKTRLDKITQGRNMSVAVRDDGKVLYERAARKKRTPASNQKLLLSMALLHHLGPEGRLDTVAHGPAPLPTGVVPGDLFVLGEGDPTLTAGKAYAPSLSITATKTGPLARAISEAGIVRIEGSVVGSTSYFGRDWWAPGWKTSFPQRYIPLPTALSFHGNRINGKHVKDPEVRMARRLTRQLRDRGVLVMGKARMAPAPTGLTEIARVSSRPLKALMKHMNRRSSNFFAETLGKRLGFERSGQPGTIAAGAAATQAWAASRNVRIESHDGSGLSYSNRASARGIVRLLTAAEKRPWGETLRMSLPKANQGTLSGRLKGARVRAKTGTLTSVSTLSGWVWLKRTSSWAEFSIMSGGLAKSKAVQLEDRIVRELRKNAR